MTTDELQMWGHRLMDWFESQGLEPRDSAKIMAMAFGAMSYGPFQAKILQAFNEMVTDVTADIAAKKKKGVS